jgi:hypothetical protein
MAATREDIGRWFDTGLEKKATHMIVATDTFDYGDYPVYVSESEDVHEVVEALSKQSMTNVMEVYHLRIDKDYQLLQDRVQNYEFPSWEPGMLIRVRSDAPHMASGFIGTVESIHVSSDGRTYLSFAVPLLSETARFTIDEQLVFLIPRPPAAPMLTIEVLRQKLDEISREVHLLSAILRDPLMDKSQVVKQIEVVQQLILKVRK